MVDACFKPCYYLSSVLAFVTTVVYIIDVTVNVHVYLLLYKCLLSFVANEFILPATLYSVCAIEACDSCTSNA